jgi:hypothetical protein
MAEGSVVQSPEAGGGRMAIGDRREEVEGAGKEGVWPDELQCGRRTLVVALAVSIQGVLLLIKLPLVAQKSGA